MRSTRARAAITTAEITNTACHDSRSVMKLAAGRASMMPRLRPLITLPTTRPRIGAGARWVAYGTRTCTATEPSPISRAAARKPAACVDSAAPSRARMATHRMASTRRRVSNRSPSGTTSSSPAP